MSKNESTATVAELARAAETAEQEIKASIDKLAALAGDHAQDIRVEITTTSSTPAFYGRTKLVAVSVRVTVVV